MAEVTDAIDEKIKAMFALCERGIEDMHPYQSDVAVPFLLANPFSALFVDMGLGKTVSSLTVIAELLFRLDGENDGPVLIIGPRRVVCETWPTEIKLWRHTCMLKHSLIHADDEHPLVSRAERHGRAAARAEGLSEGEINRAGGKAGTAAKELLRVQAVKRQANVYLVSRDWVEWLVAYWGPRWPYRTVFVDESSSFKDHKSGRFKALARVRNTEGLITRLHCLTATPAAETYEHLFAQVYLLDKGERLGQFITHYRQRYFAENRWTYKWEMRPGSEELILEKISDICLVMKAEDYLDLDEPTIQQHHIVLDDESMALYNKMQKDFVVTLPDGTEVEAETAAALSQKLLQMASGVLYETYFDGDIETEDMKKVKRVHRIHDCKIDALKEKVEALGEKTVLVAYHHKASLDRLRKAFPKAVVMDRDGKCVKPWNAGKIKMLLIHPQSGGHGLNMQKGGHNIIFYDLPWSLELFSQLIGRLARQGQTHPVLVQILTTLGTLDEQVYKSLVLKEDVQNKLFSILKRMIKKVRGK